MGPFTGVLSACINKTDFHPSPLLPAVDCQYLLGSRRHFTQPPLSMLGFGLAWNCTGFL